MKIIKGIKTILRLPIQSIGKAVDRFMVCFFPRSRTYLVHAINRYRWLSNALRRCAGKPLFFGKNQLPVEDLFSSLSMDIQSLAIKIILKIGKFVLCHQKIKKICKYLLRYFPTLRNKLAQAFYTPHDYFYSSSAILNTVRLSPKAKSIYKLLEK